MGLANNLWDGVRTAGSLLWGRPRPLFALILPTYRCNIRCAYCALPYMEAKELKTGQWLEVIDELADLGCRRITISGGEPLMRNDVPLLIGRIRQRGMSCALVSNGLLVKRRVGELGHLSALVLSLDGVGEANDEVRGHGVFEAVKEAVDAAQAAGLAVKINAVMSSPTAPCLDELLAFIEEYDLYVTVTVMRSGEKDLWHEARGIKAEDKEIRETLERLAELARRSPRLLHSESTYRYAARWRDYAVDRYEAHQLPPDDPLRRGGPPCQAGRYYLMIGPEGTVCPCPQTLGRIPGGNVVEEGVGEAWRRINHHDCVACYSPCYVEFNHFFSLHPRVVLNFVRKNMNPFF